MRSPLACVTRPASGCSRPASTRSSVVLPAPLRPTTPMRSRSAMPSDTSSSKGRTPYESETDSRLTRFMRRRALLAPDRARAARVRQVPEPASAATKRDGRGLVGDEKRAGRARTADDGGERMRVAAGFESAPQRRLQRDRGALEIVVEQRPEPARLARPQRGDELMRSRRFGRQRFCAQPVEFGVDGRRRESAVGDREHPVVGAPREHAGELLAATGTERGAAEQAERHVAAEVEREVVQHRRHRGGCATARRRRPASRPRRPIRRPCRRRPECSCES